MDTFAIKNEDGSIELVPMLMVGSSLIGRGMYVFIGTDFHGDKSFKIETGIKSARSECLGKLYDQDVLVWPAMLTIIKKLNWDLEKYPDPEVIYINI